MSDLDQFVGLVYEDRDPRSYERRVKIIGVERGPRVSKLVAEVISHPTNPQVVGRRVRLGIRTLMSHYRKV